MYIYTEEFKYIAIYTYIYTQFRMPIYIHKFKYVCVFVDTSSY